MQSKFMIKIILQVIVLFILFSGSIYSLNDTLRPPSIIGIKRGRNSSSGVDSLMSKNSFAKFQTIVDLFPVELSQDRAIIVFDKPYDDYIGESNDVSILEKRLNDMLKTFKFFTKNQIVGYIAIPKGASVKDILQKAVNESKLNIGVIRQKINRTSFKYHNNI